MLMVVVVLVAVVILVVNQTHLVVSAWEGMDPVLNVAMTMTVKISKSVLIMGTTTKITAQFVTTPITKATNQSQIGVAV